MRKYFGLVRFPNLLMIALTQVLVRYCLIMPAFKAEYFATSNFPSHLSDLDFILLVISSVLIAAAGYIINDSFDIHMDEINRPGTNIIGKSISLRAAKRSYFILSIAGSVIGIYLGIKISMPLIGIIPLFSAISLWMYSSFYKRRFLIGNIIISILSALSVLIVGLFEPEFYRNISFLFWYAIVAFLLSFIRELIKDIEDVEGDTMSQCKTVPIIWGIKKTKILIAFLIVATLTYIAFILSENFYNNKVVDFWYLIGMFLIPFLSLMYLVLTANEKKDYYYASLFSKILMLAGILSIFPFWYFFLK